MTTAIELCDRSFNKLHELSTGSFEGVLRRNEPGEWRVSMHGDEARDVLAQVGAVVVRDERRILFAGYRASTPSGLGGTMREIDADGRRVTIEGVDCWKWLTDRAVFPDPATAEPWSVAADVRTGTGGAVIAAFVNANAGSSALTDRQIVGLQVIGSTVGTVGEWSARLQPLSDLVTRIALESGVVIEPTLSPSRVPTVYLRTAADRTADMVVADIADLGYAEQRDVPPSATWVLAAGEGEGTARMFRSAGGGTGIDRIERVIEYTNAATSNELFQFADATRREAGFAFYVSGRTTIGALEQYRYIDDYRLGDLISVQVDGVRFPVPVAAVELKVDATTSGTAAIEFPVLGTYTPERLRTVDKRLLGLDRHNDNNLA